MAKPTKSRKSRQAPDIRKFRSDIAKLKSLGLVSSRVDARSQKMTRHMKSQIKKYSDVLEGRAVAVKVPKQRDARAYKDQFRVKGNRVVVPKKPNETLRYAPKRGEIIGTVRRGDKTSKVFYRKEKASAETRLSDHQAFMITFASKGSETFDDYKQLENFMSPYEASWKNWRDYVQIVER